MGTIVFVASLAQVGKLTLVPGWMPCATFNPFPEIGPLLKAGVLGLAFFVLGLSFYLINGVRNHPDAAAQQATRLNAMILLGTGIVLVFLCGLVQVATPLIADPHPDSTPLVSSVTPPVSASATSKQEALNALRSPTPEPTKAKVHVFFQVPPLQQGDDIRYGKVSVKIRHLRTEDDVRTIEPIGEAGANLEISDDDTIIVNVRDMTSHMDTIIHPSGKKTSASLASTKPNY